METFCGFVCPIDTVLLVDDDPEWMDFLVRIIGVRYPVATCMSGDDAVRRATAIKPSVIVMDGMMPGGMNGFAAFAELQKNPDCQRVPVIMLTEVNRKTGLKFGSRDMAEYSGQAPAVFLEKPIVPEKLLHAISQAVANAGATGKHCSEPHAERAGSAKWHSSRDWPIVNDKRLKVCRVTHR